MQVLKTKKNIKPSKIILSKNAKTKKQKNKEYHQKRVDNIDQTVQMPKNTIKSIVKKIQKKHDSYHDKLIRSLTDINFKLDVVLKRRSTTNKEFSKLKINVAPYTYTSVQHNDVIFKKLYVNKIKTWPTYYKSTMKLRDTISYVTEGYARGISKYVNDKYKQEYKVTNAFIKLWEIYNTYDWLLPKNKEVIKIFHMAEAPGQWINTTNTYFKHHMPASAVYDWYANSLNPDHPKNKGISALKDEYGLIKKYSDKWLWGADETGDITLPKNIQWYGNFIKDNLGSLDIVTGDAGLSLHNPSLFFLQKLEFAQMVMVACTATPGSSCIVKHFLPYIPKLEESKKGYGFFVSFMYMYHLMFKEFHMIKPLSSNPLSGEFYVVASGFLGLPEDVKLKLQDALLNFKVNHAIFEKNDIPKMVLDKILMFINKLQNLNIKSNNLELEVIKYIRKKPSKLDCEYYFSKEFKIEKEQEFEKWMAKYKLNLKQ